MLRGGEVNWTNEMMSLLDRNPIAIHAPCDELWAYEEPQGVAIYNRSGRVALIDYKRCEAYLKRRRRAIGAAKDE